MNYQIHHALSSLRNGAEFVVVGNSLSNIDWHDTKQSQPTDADINAEISRLTAAEPMRLLRVERNKRLEETDWWVIRGNVTEAQLNYRQLLRDLPENTDDPATPTWPEKP
jgi:hypothetical protein|tara:strand:- start:779 stop:1108 length:330 start_codon:yes stop_codon:yes gene_type:complete